jgi:hypothetical protein
VRQDRFNGDRTNRYLDFNRPEDGNAPPRWYTNTAEFSDYGTKVRVERPI